MSNIGDWLNGLGLGQFAELFRDNLIDLDVLPDLNEADLEKLELPLGARKKILKAAQALDLSIGSDQPAGFAKTSAVFAPVAAAQAERRQLTVMFVDLVGSTALSARLDPEEMGAVLRGYQNAVAGEIARFEGHVAKFMGDGVLAYFGWPVAHEDEAERAVRAGLAIVAAVARLSGGEAPLACRIGVATGLVVVGELIGEGAAQEQTVVGDTPNLAARLQGLAAPGQVVVAEATRRLLGAGFVLDDLGVQALKGIAGAVGAFAVGGERVLASRFEGRAHGLQPMVGRDQELALLMERWAQAEAGEGQAVLLVGEAGVGKSRISRALLDALGERPHVRIRYQCSPYHTGSALWPAIQQLEHAARFAAADPLETRLDKLEQALGDGGAERAPLIAHLLGLDGSARYGALELAPTVLRARTLDALVLQLLRLATTRPVLLLIEDAHWADPTTLELIEAWLDAIATAPVLLVLTSRPDNQPALAAHPHVTRLSLNRLGRAGVEAIVTRLGGDRLPPATIDTIIARTDGVPLYVEELTKAVLETGEAAIPASLHDSLMARLDRTPEVKEIAQIAACIGREFDHALLAAVADRPPAELSSALDKLATAELVFRRGTPPDARYTFKHALVRDAAYESLLKSRRQALHQRLLEALEGAGAAAELLALHAEAAGLVERAIDYYQAAGEAAARRPAFLEAIANLRRAVALVETLGDARAWRERALELRVLIGQASIGGFGHSAAETGAAYQAALDLLHELGQSPLWLSIYYGNWAYRYVGADLRAALRLGEEMAERAALGTDDAATMVSHRLLGTCHSIMGRSGEALRHLDTARQLYDPLRHQSLAVLVGQEPGVTIVCYQALSLAQRGFSDQARQHVDPVVDLARKSGHALTIAYALGHATVISLVLRETTRAMAFANENLAFCEAKGIKVWQAYSLGFLAVAGSLSGQDDAALAAAERARPLLEATGTRLFVPLILSGELRSLLALGRYAACAERLHDIRARTEAGAEHWLDADIQRLEGDLRLAQGDPAAAEACYRRAIDIAITQEAKLFELRATTALARLWAERGERQQALDLLAPIHGWFTEGFDLPDLIESKALL
jgi:class 3 adenylate cyclase/tetratricopeptide (TPR) repeat protein